MTKTKLLDLIEEYKHGYISPEDMLTAVDAFSAALLQQTPCSTLREVLVQELNKEQQYYNTKYMNQPTMVSKAAKIGMLTWVLSLIVPKKPVA